MKPEGIVLFAHGSRDPEWARPFQQIERILAGKGMAVRLAYLEIMEPSLDEAIRQLVERKVASIRIVPLFLGYGGHIRKDLPDLVAAANPKVKVTIDPPVGEQPQVIAAIVEAIAAGACR